MNLNFLEIFLYQIILTLLHEAGHIIAALLLKLKIYKIGFLLKPYPHFFVAVNYPTKKIFKYIYLFSGPFLTIVLFIISLYFNFFNNNLMYLAFLVQIVIETNPFYSDYTIAAVVNKIDFKNRKKTFYTQYNQEFSKYQYSLRWYIHFIIWVVIFINLYKSINYV